MCDENFEELRPPSVAKRRRDPSPQESKRSKRRCDMKSKPPATESKEKDLPRRKQICSMFASSGDEDDDDGDDGCKSAPAKWSSKKEPCSTAIPIDAKKKEGIPDASGDEIIKCRRSSRLGKRLMIEESDDDGEISVKVQEAGDNDDGAVKLTSVRRSLRKRHHSVDVKGNNGGEDECDDSLPMERVSKPVKHNSRQHNAPDGKDGGDEDRAVELTPVTNLRRSLRNRQQDNCSMATPTNAKESDKDTDDEIFVKVQEEAGNSGRSKGAELASSSSRSLRKKQCLTSAPSSNKGENDSEATVVTTPIRRSLRKKQDYRKHSTAPATEENNELVDGGLTSGGMSTEEAYENDTEQTMEVGKVVSQDGDGDAPEKVEDMILVGPQGMIAEAAEENMASEITGKMVEVTIETPQEVTTGTEIVDCWVAMETTPVQEEVVISKEADDEVNEEVATETVSVTEQAKGIGTRTKRVPDNNSVKKKKVKKAKKSGRKGKVAEKLVKNGSDHTAPLAAGDNRLLEGNKDKSNDGVGVAESNDGVGVAESTDSVGMVESNDNMGVVKSNNVGVTDSHRKSNRWRKSKVPRRSKISMSTCDFNLDAILNDTSTIIKIPDSKKPHPISLTPLCPQSDDSSTPCASLIPDLCPNEPQSSTPECCTEDNSDSLMCEPPSMGTGSAHTSIEDFNFKLSSIEVDTVNDIVPDTGQILTEDPLSIDEPSAPPTDHTSQQDADQLMPHPSESQPHPQNDQSMEVQENVLSPDEDDIISELNDDVVSLYVHEHIDEIPPSPTCPPPKSSANPCISSRKPSSCLPKFPPSVDSHSPTDTPFIPSRLPFPNNTPPFPTPYGPSPPPGPLWATPHLPPSPMSAPPPPTPPMFTPPHTSFSNNHNYKKTQVHQWVCQQQRDPPPPLPCGMFSSPSQPDPPPPLPQGMPPCPNQPEPHRMSFNIGNSCSSRYR